MVTRSRGPLEEDLDRKPRAAVFWDAENVTFKDERSIAEEFRKWIEDKYTPDALLAFADWNGPYRDQGRLLYRIGFDLIHVPDELKDSADCQMAAYAVDWLLRSPRTSTYVLASGDAVFEPLILALQKQGKEVVVISNPLTTRPETILRADDYRDIDSFRPTILKLETIEDEKAQKMTPEKTRDVAFRRLQEAITKLKKLGRKTPRKYVKAVAEHLNPGLKMGEEGYDTWDQIISQALSERLVGLEGDEPYAQLVLTRKVAKISEDETESLDKMMQEFRDIVEEMHEKGEHTGMESVVHRVREENLDYTQLGYNKFGDFARAAESRDLIRIVERDDSPPALKPAYTFDKMLEWYQNNTRKFFGQGAKVPSDRFIKRTLRMLYKYDASISEMEEYLRDPDIREVYNQILNASGLSFIPPYEQILLSILLGKGWGCERSIEVVNQELSPLGYEIECP